MQRVEIRTKKYYSVWESTLLLGGRIISVNEGDYGEDSTLVFEVETSNCCRLVNKLEQVYGIEVLITLEKLEEMPAGADS